MARAHLAAAGLIILLFLSMATAAGRAHWDTAFGVGLALVLISRIAV
jgi:hypothetical protein